MVIIDGKGIVDNETMPADIGTMNTTLTAIEALQTSIDSKLGSDFDAVAGTNLNAVGVTGAGADISMLGFKSVTFQIIASGVTIGGTMTIEGTLDGTNYTVLDTTVVIANGATTYSTQGEPYFAVRANLSAWTDGVYSALYMRN